MSRKNYEAVLNHLLFHKALISDGDEKINEYIDIVKNMEEGSLASAENQVDKCIVIVFDLVLKNKFDPWSIDLVEFCKLYLKRIRKEDDINFIIAGHIVHLAWSILKLQSKDVLFNADKEEEYYFQDWDVDEIYENPEDIDYVHEVLQHPKPAIQEMIRREEKRQITLMELVDAFDDARKDAERRKTLSKLRKSQYRVPNFRDKVHKENLQQDIALTWQRICKLNGDMMPFHFIHNGKTNERIGAFVSILYLVQMKKINIWQKGFPFGEILIKNLIPKENRKVESEILINELFDESSNEVLIKDLAVI